MNKGPNVFSVVLSYVFANFKTFECPKKLQEIVSTTERIEKQTHQRMKRNLTILEMTLKNGNRDKKIRSTSVALSFTVFVPNLSVFSNCLSLPDVNSYLVIAIFLSCKFFSLRQRNFVSTKSKCGSSCKCKLVDADSTEFDGSFESLLKWFFIVFSQAFKDIP